MLEKMRNRIKNEKGFTLVELLAVIVILAIILAVAIPAVGSIVNKAKDDTHEANTELFENAARLAYVSDTVEGGKTYPLGDLVSGGYLEKIPENPKTGEMYTGGVKVEVDSTTNEVTYKYE